MNENLPYFGGVSALLVGNKAAHPGKHPQLTSDFVDAKSTLVVLAWEGSSPKNKETKCEGKALEVTTALWKVEQEARCFYTVSETRRIHH